jgi:hypothetical protein
LLITGSVGAAAGIAAYQGPKLTGDEIIQKHLAAVGGKEALTKFKTRVALGTIKKDNEPEGQLAVMSESPNRLSVFYGFRDFDLRMIYDGNTAHIRPSMPRQLAPLSRKYEEILASGLAFNSISLYNLITNSSEGQLKFEAKGTKKINGREAYAVQLKPAKGSAMKLFFDAENFMWVRTEYGKASLSKEMGTFTNDVVSQAGSEVTVDFYLDTSDFREVDGVKLPFKFEQVMTAPILRQKSIGTVVGTFKEYQHNIDIDPKMFQ